MVFGSRLTAPSPQSRTKRRQSSYSPSCQSVVIAVAVLSPADCQFSTTSKLAKLARQKTVQNEHSGLTTLADARLRHRDQPIFQFYDQPQDCKGAARKFLCSTNPFVRGLPARAAMKRCAQCQGRLGLGVRSRNLWNGGWWVHVRFCSTHCEALYELERYDVTPRQSFAVRGPLDAEP